MSNLQWPHPKDPNSSRGYALLWYDFLEISEVIISSVWVIPTDLISTIDGFQDKQTGVQLEGGTDGESYECKNTIETSSDNTIVRTVTLKVKNR